MSWSGFKKNLNRATTSVMSKTGNMDRTADREFEEEERRGKILEAKSEALYKEANGYIQSLRNVTGTQVRIATTIEQYFDEADPMGAYGVKYKEAVTKLEEEVREDVDAGFRQAVLEPIGRYYAYFPEIGEAVRRRNKKLLDYDTARSKVRKLVERPSEDHTKLPRAEHEAEVTREMYEAMNAQLTAELPKVIDSRIAYLDPSFEAAVKSQLSFAQDARNAMEPLRQYFPAEPHGHELEQAADGILGEMSDLQICRLAM
ncbi:MAG: hypothetical protein BYD32DRAFT_422056 [Podila humilis]|nr:MAG: hypothetical protein BYD32DRAFT_422056 [Podila humilis]